MKTLNVKGFNTSQVTDMEQIFSNCSSLTFISGLAYWNTSNVTDMGYLFYNCSSLTSLDLSTWNVSNVTNMSHMLEGCSSLRTLNLKGWSFEKIKLLVNEGNLPTGKTSGIFPMNRTLKSDFGDIEGQDLMILPDGWKGTN